MKKYMKPTLMALSISANDQLCSGCGTATKTDSWFFDFINLPESGWEDTNKNGYYDDGDNATVFNDGTACDLPAIGYCKYTAADDGLQQIFTS